MSGDKGRGGKPGKGGKAGQRKSQPARPGPVRQGPIRSGPVASGSARVDKPSGRKPRSVTDVEPTDRLVVGLHPVRELLRAGHRLREVLVDAEREPSEVLDEILELAGRTKAQVREVSRSRIDDLAEGMVHQGVVAKAGAFPYAGLDRCAALARQRGEAIFLVALDGVTDPHNLGAIARSAEGFGAHGLLIPSRRSAAVTPVVEKAAAGALAHLPLVRVPNLVSVLKSLKEGGVWIVGLDSEESRPIGQCDLLTEGVVIVVGSEGKGLGRLTHVTCDQLVKLPMHGHVGSFNASVAAAVTLFEVQRRRGL
jgi:23S rRNA (guanosine2251-2'-O)-methyltransferase